jgi:hypothetical protein
MFDALGNGKLWSVHRICDSLYPCPNFISRVSESRYFFRVVPYDRDDRYYISDQAYPPLTSVILSHQ